MEVQEFPKMLYRGDDWHIVANAAEEDAARADGFRFHSDAAEDAEPVKRGPGRPRKVAE